MAASRDELMDARLRAAREKEEAIPGSVGGGRVLPATARGHNTNGIKADETARRAAASFASNILIRRETPVITPVARGVQEGVRKVLGAMLPQNDLPQVRDVGVKQLQRYLELDPMYLYIKGAKGSARSEAVIYRRHLDAAYDSEADEIVLRHSGPKGALRIMRFRGIADDDHRNWVRLLTGQEVPDIEDSYVMVYRTLEMPGVVYPLLDGPDGVMNPDGPRAEAGAAPAPAPSAPPTPAADATAGLAAVAPAAISGAGKAGYCVADPAAAPPAYLYDESAQRTPSDEPPPYFG
mmetsp:Transcript_13719/g.35216  ORF Transcript_13719/g.35216 Transcript_13719/m.35216 type:complete len:294 (-) Transcript_13719:1064-1945(-)